MTDPGTTRACLARDRALAVARGARLSRHLRQEVKSYTSGLHEFSVGESRVTPESTVVFTRGKSEWVVGATESLGRGR